MSNASDVEVQEKHLSLHEAIMSINSITDHLNTLINKIQGSIPPKTSSSDAVKEKPERNEPSLFEVLESSPQYIRDRVDEIHHRIEALEANLF